MIYDKVLIELSEAGYKVDQDDQRKIAYHVKGKLKKDEGTSVKWEDGKLKLEFNKFYDAAFIVVLFYINL